MGMLVTLVIGKFIVQLLYILNKMLLVKYLFDFCSLANVLGLYKCLGANIFLLEYRGFGLSEGKPSENGFYADARAALDYLKSRNDLNNEEIILFGRSLGKF